MSFSFTPDMTADSIYNIDFDELYSRGITALIIDIDNTLVSHRVKLPDDAALSLIQGLLKSGFRLAVISNGKKERVSLFTAELGIPVISGHMKPKKSGYRLALAAMGAKPEQCAAIGDQLFTDVLGANRMGICSVYTEPIEKYENPFFYIKRFLEYFILKKKR